MKTVIALATFALIAGSAQAQIYPVIAGHAQEQSSKPAADTHGRNTTPPCCSGVNWSCAEAMVVKEQFDTNKELLAQTEEAYKKLGKQGVAAKPMLDGMKVYSQAMQPYMDDISRQCLAHPSTPQH